MEGFKGKCMFMCPEAERRWREKHGLLHKYETLNIAPKSSSHPSADVNKAVKQYCRPAAGKKPVTENELRPLPVLQRTVHYLIENVMNQKDEKWIDIYEFCADRLRAVNQDLIIGRICGVESSWILESAVRFYLYSDYRLFEESSVLQFDAHINTTLLMECLKRLMVLYGNRQDFSGPCMDSLAQMTAIYLLFNLESTNALTYILALQKPLKRHPVLSMAIEVSLAHLSNNYLFVLRAFRRVPFLLACCLHKHLDYLRRQLLARLCAGFGSRDCRFPSQLLSEWLALKDDDLRHLGQLCGHYGIGLCEEGTRVCFLKNGFDRSADQAPRRRDAILDLQLKKLDPVRLIGTPEPPSTTELWTDRE